MIQSPKRENAANEEPHLILLLCSRNRSVSHRLEHDLSLVSSCRSLPIHPALPSLRGDYVLQNRLR